MPAVMVASDAIFFGQRQRIAELALNNRLPTMFSLREYAEAGGLMSYGENIADFFHHAAFYVDKIYKGAKAGDLPIEQPTRFNLVRRIGVLAPYAQDDPETKVRFAAFRHGLERLGWSEGRNVRIDSLFPWIAGPSIWITGQPASASSLSSSFMALESAMVSSRRSL